VVGADIKNQLFAVNDTRIAGHLQKTVIDGSLFRCLENRAITLSRDGNQQNTETGDAMYFHITNRQITLYEKAITDFPDRHAVSPAHFVSGSAAADNCKRSFVHQFR
jgi:hypothetical protein